MEDDERYEQLIAFLGSQLPSPVDQHSAGDGSLIFTAGNPAEVVVQLSGASVIVAEYGGLWVGPDRFVVRPRRIGLLRWRRLSESATIQALSALIKGARESRLSRYRPCTACNEKSPPELLFGGDVCQDCAELRRHVVH